jgi:hypothetical protein
LIFQFWLDTVDNRIGALVPKNKLRPDFVNWSSSCYPIDAIDLIKDRTDVTYKWLGCVGFYNNVAGVCVSELGICSRYESL